MKLLVSNGNLRRKAEQVSSISKLRKKYPVLKKKYHQMITKNCYIAV